MNKVIEVGRIPFDLELKNGDDEKKAFLGFSVSVQRNYKPEGEKYYPEDLLFCKAFGAKAKFIAKHWNKGDYIVVEGRLERDDDYEKDGENVKGQMYVKVTDVEFVPRTSGNKSSEEAEEKPAKKNDKKADNKAPNPLAGNKKKNPFLGK